MHTLDTNAIIYYLDPDLTVAEIIDAIFAQDDAIYVSTITELELFSHSGLSDEDMAQIEQLLTSVVRVPVDSQLARVAADLRRLYRLKTPDSAIAATALLTHTTLVTRNIRDFRHVKELRLLEI